MERRFGREGAAARREAATGQRGAVVGVVDAPSVAAACRDVPAGEQRRCPLEAHAPISATDIDGGVRLALGAGERDGAVRDAITCYEARRGRGAPDGPCPFDLRGISTTVSVEGDRVSVVVVGDPMRAGLIRERARRYVRP